MKRKIIYAFSLITFLSLGGVSLVSCDPEINEVEETKYKVNFTNTNDYEITGINTEGYLENEIVNFEINVLNENLMINEVMRLKPRDRDIMILRYGLMGHDELTQKEVAEKLGISQSYISRIEKKVIKRLKMLVNCS